MRQAGPISALYFGGAIALAGMPPLSGFLGKLLVMDAARGADVAGGTATVWAVILISSFIAIVGLARAGSVLFWKSHDAAYKREPEPGQEPDADMALPEPAPEPLAALPFVAAFGLLAGLAALTVFAGPVMDYATATADQLFQPAAYLDTVLGRAE